MEMPPIHLVVTESTKLLEGIAKNKNTTYHTRERATNENKAETRKKERLWTIRYTEWDLWRLDKAPHCKTGEMDYVDATGIARPSNPNPDRSWMLQSTSFPKGWHLPSVSIVEGSGIRPDMSSSNIDGGAWKERTCSWRWDYVGNLIEKMERADDSKDALFCSSPIR